MFKRSSTARAIYELRTYKLLPANYPQYLAATAASFHLRTKHSKLVGFWATEIGGVNEVVHIWQYDNLQARKRVRDALAADAEWMTYVVAIRPWLQLQQNELMVPFDEEQFESTDGHFYLLERGVAPLVAQPSQKKLLGSWGITIGEREKPTVQLFSSANLDDLVPPVGRNDGSSSKLLYPVPWSKALGTIWN